VEGRSCSVLIRLRNLILSDLQYGTLMCKEFKWFKSELHFSLFPLNSDADCCHFSAVILDDGRMCTWEITLAIFLGMKHEGVCLQAVIRNRVAFELPSQW
jgi:hypothetical protein